MNVRFLPIHIVFSAVVSGCATPQEPQRPPVAWAQTKDEVGLLRVGKVRSVERVFLRAEPSNRSSVFPAAAGAIGILPALVLSPLADHLSAGGDWCFRHTIETEGEPQLVQRDEFWEFKPGDCVALRDKPFLLVPAHPGACDKPTSNPSIERTTSGVLRTPTVAAHVKR